MTSESWHRLASCSPDEPTLHGRCYNCGAEEPEPVEDFENGYDTELTCWGHCTLDWVDRANMRVLTMRDMLRRYSAPSRIEELSMRASPFMREVQRRAG